MSNSQSFDDSSVPPCPATKRHEHYAANRALARQIADQGRAEPDPSLGALAIIKSQLLEVSVSTHESFAPALEHPLSPDELTPLFSLFSAETQVAQMILACEKVELCRRHQLAEVAEAQDAHRSEQVQLQEHSRTDDSAGTPADTHEHVPHDATSNELT
jgi:hypothetical protein